MSQSAILIRGLNRNGKVIEDMKYYPKSIDRDEQVELCALNFIHFMSNQSVEIEVLDLNNYENAETVILSTK